MLASMLLSAGVTAGEKHCSYLAVVGPEGLRFAAPSPRYRPDDVLPPLKMSDAPVTNTVETVATPVEQPVLPKPLEEKPVEPVAGPGPAAVAPAPGFVPESAPAAVPPSGPSEPKNIPNEMTPQMLLRYFNRDGSKEVLVPTGVEFTPPAPSTGGRSSAVYLSPPAK